MNQLVDPFTLLPEGFVIEGQPPPPADWTPEQDIDPITMLPEGFEIEDRPGQAVVPRPLQQPAPAAQRAEKSIKARAEIDGKTYVRHETGTIYEQLPGGDFKAVWNPEISKALGGRGGTARGKRIAEAFANKVTDQETPGGFGTEFWKAARSSGSSLHLRNAAYTMLTIYEQQTGTEMDMEKDPAAETIKWLLKSADDLDKEIGSPNVAALKDIKFMEPGGGDRLLEYIGQAMGQAGGSTLPMLLSGAAGATLFAPAGKAAQVAGGVSAAFMAGSVLNVGDMYKSLVDEGVTDPVARGKWAMIGGSVMSSLDTLLPAQIVGQFTAPVKRELSRYVARRLMQRLGHAVIAGAKGAGVEGFTEGTQDVLKLVISRDQAGKPVIAVSS